MSHWLMDVKKDLERVVQKLLFHPNLLNSIATKTVKPSTLWRRIVDCHWFYSSLTLDADQWEAADAGEREGRGTRGFN